MCLVSYIIKSFPISNMSPRVQDRPVKLELVDVTLNEPLLLDREPPPLAQVKPSSTGLDRRAGLLKASSEAEAGLAKALGDGVEPGIIRKGLDKLATGLRVAGYFAVGVMAAADANLALAPGGNMAGEQGRPGAVGQLWPGKTESPVAASATSQAKTYAPDLEQVGRVMSQMQGTKGDTAEDYLKYQDKFWGLLPEKERDFWTGRSREITSKMGGASCIDRNPKGEALRHYMCWDVCADQDREREFKDKHVLWGLMPESERNLWRSQAKRPQVPEGDVRILDAKETRVFIERTMKDISSADQAAEYKAYDHYRGMKLAPEAAPKGAGLRDFVSDEVTYRMGRAQYMEDLTLNLGKKANVRGDGPDWRLIQSAATFIERDRAQSLSPTTYYPYSSSPEDRETINGAVKNASAPFIREMMGAEKRTAILKKHGITVSDGSMFFEDGELEQVHQILDNTPPHLAKRILKGGIIKCVPTDDELKKGKAGEYRRDTLHMRLLLEAKDPRTIHHEVWHSVQEEALSPQEFREFARLGGWEIWVDKDKGISRKVQDTDDLNNYFLPGQWKKPPATSVARPYGLECPREDWATLGEEYSHSTRGLAEKALFQEKGGDPTLRKKTQWMMGHAMKDQDSGKTYVYDGKGRMHATDAAADPSMEELARLAGEPAEKEQ